MTTYRVLVTEIDFDHGGAAHDLTSDVVFRRLLLETQRGEFDAGVAGFPCSTCSYARVLDPDHEPPVVRDKWFPDGRHMVPPAHIKELKVANLLFRRGSKLLRVIAGQGKPVVVENPAARWDPSALGGRLWHSASTLGRDGSFWQTSPAIALLKEAEEVETEHASLRFTRDGRVVLL